MIVKYVAFAKYEYDDFNRLTHAFKGGVRADYAYTADGLRASQTVNNITSRWLWDGTRLVKDGDTNYYYGANLISSSVGNYYVFNGHGDVVALTDSAGQVTKTYDYDAFGVETNPDWEDTNPFRYCGEYYDKGTGSIYLRARTYDPTTGRFNQPDTHWNVNNMIYGDKVYEVGEVKFPDITAIHQSGNLYVYCMNNPIYYMDLDGLLAYPGQIHNLVVNRVAEIYGFNKEQTISYKIGWGRADLISNSGYVWDVKRDKPKQIAAGKAQVQKYVDNTWKARPKVKLHKGGWIASGEFVTKINVDTYYVTYRYAGEGVIAYDYYKVTDWEKVKEYAFMTGMTVVSAVVFLASQGTIQLQPMF